MDLKISLFQKEWKNPLIAASGCFGFGREASQFQDLRDWGGLCGKGLTLHPRSGNPAPRICETASGMLNSVGLQNPGLDVFLSSELPYMLSQHDRVIANVAGNSAGDYGVFCERLNDSGLTAIELNLSCPNVSKGCMLIGSKPRLVEETVAYARARTKLPLIAKLTPNTADIAACAKAAEAGGADAVSLVNTFLGLAVDLKSRRPVLKNNTGGLSGPAIKPIALRMCFDVYRAVQIPVIAMGGIDSGQDALEFILAGASAVQLGMVNFYRQRAAAAVAEEMRGLGETLGLASVAELKGQLKYWENV